MAGTQPLDPGPVHASNAELHRLIQLFDGSTDKKAKRARPLPPLKIVQNRVMKSMDLRRMYYFRYGTEQPSNNVQLSYPKIAKRMLLPVSTVYNALRRFERDGLSFVDRRRNNFKRAHQGRLKIKGAVKDYLLSYEVLTEWAPLSLDKRVKLLAQMGVHVRPHTLSLFYRRHKVTYRVVKYEFSRARKVPLTEIQSFVVDLARRIERNQNIVYFDETSCNMWMRKRYTWCTRDNPVRMHLNKNRGHGITIMGAIGHRLPKGVFSIAKTTNQ
jgi:transposase